MPKTSRKPLTQPRKRPQQTRSLTTVEAILEATARILVQEGLEHTTTKRPRALSQNVPLPLRERIRLAVEWHLALHAANPALHQALIVYAPEILELDAMRGFERMVQSTIHEVLQQHEDEIRPKHLNIASFIVAQSLESLTHAAVVYHPELLAHPELADEMTQLLVGYTGC